MGYTYSQLEGYWVNNGGDPKVAPVMAAIAMAESGGGNVIQKGQPYQTTGWGLWQITPGNSVPSAGVDNALLDPNANAKAAVAKYKSQGLSAWATYTSGAYKQFLKSGVAPTTGPGGSQPAGGGDGSTGDIGGAIGQGFADAFMSILKPFVEILIWGVETLGGAALMILGAFIIMQSSPTVRKAEVEVGADAASIAEPEAAPAIQAKKSQAKEIVAPENKKARSTFDSPSDEHGNKGKVVTDWGFGPGFWSEENFPAEIRKRRKERYDRGNKAIDQAHRRTMTRAKYAKEG